MASCKGHSGLYFRPGAPCPLGKLALATRAPPSGVQASVPPAAACSHPIHPDKMQHVSTHFHKLFPIHRADISEEILQTDFIQYKLSSLD